jgi:hypothetical protein
LRARGKEGRFGPGAGGQPPARVSPRRADRRQGTALFLACLVLLSSCHQSSRPAPREVPLRPASIDARSEAFLDDLQRRTFLWFWELADPRNGLVPDRAPTPSFSSVAAVGFGLTAYTVGAERGWVSRSEAAERVARTISFLNDAPQGDAPTGVTGYRGLFYHFLDMKTGRRFERIELSTIDTALLAAGALNCQSYFDRDDPLEARVRGEADQLYRRIEWDWIQPRPPGIAMGWTPEDGFHAWNWRGYDESMILLILALGSPTHPVDAAVWEDWVGGYRWGQFHGQTYVNFSPLFGYQYSHVWVDFRGIQDRYMREKGIDYFENSRRATLAHRGYAVANPMAWSGYGPDVWGLTACDGPVDAKVSLGGRERELHSYWPRGASLLHVNDDGTLAPTAAAGSVPFAPEIAIPALREMARRWGEHAINRYGFLDSFNPSLTDPGFAVKHGRIVPGIGWFNGDQLGIDQGPIVAMIENHRSELIWKTMRRNPYIAAGLKRAGFTGGWLERAAR